MLLLQSSKAPAWIALKLGFKITLNKDSSCPILISSSSHNFTVNESSSKLFKKDFINNQVNAIIFSFGVGKSYIKDKQYGFNDTHNMYFIRVGSIYFDCSFGEHLREFSKETEKWYQYKEARMKSRLKEEDWYLCLIMQI